MHGQPSITMDQKRFRFAQQVANSYFKLLGTHGIIYNEAPFTKTVAWRWSSTHYQPPEVTGQLHAPDLSPGGQWPGTHWIWGWVGPDHVFTWSQKEQFLKSTPHCLFRIAVTIPCYPRFGKIFRMFRKRLFWSVNLLVEPFVGQSEVGCWELICLC
jgi:hypothetical protein